MALSDKEQELVSDYPRVKEVVDKLCTCEYILPSQSAVDPTAHRADCQYRLICKRLAQFFLTLLD